LDYERLDERALRVAVPVYTLPSDTYSSYSFLSKERAVKT
jgi:hypothetical protein